MVDSTYAAASGSHAATPELAAAERGFLVHECDEANRDIGEGCEQARDLEQRGDARRVVVRTG